MTMLTGFPRTRWPRRRFSENYAVRISVKITRICEFRVIMGTMSDLLGWCSSSTLGSRANDYVKTLATLGFWLHHSPCPFGCWTNNTLAARSLSPHYFRRYISRSSVWSASDVATYSWTSSGNGLVSNKRKKIPEPIMTPVRWSVNIIRFQCATIGLGPLWKGSHFLFTSCINQNELWCDKISITSGF